MLQQGPTMAVDDAFRQSRRAGGVHDEQWMVERDLLIHDRRRRMRVKEGIVANGTTNSGERRLTACVGTNDDSLQGGHGRDDVSYPWERVDLLARIEVSIGAHQHLGRDLPEPVNRTLYPK